MKNKLVLEHLEEERQFLELALRQPSVRNINDFIFLALAYHS